MAPRRAARATKSTPDTCCSLREKIDHLSRRVRRLEQALTKAPQGSSKRADAAHRLSTARWKARNEAIDDFFHGKPTREQIARRRKRDAELNKFLKARGFEPFGER